MESEEEVLSIQDLWVYYDGISILEDVSLSVTRGDFLGIIGPNGGGKTTLLKAILGLVNPSRGGVQILGQPPDKSRCYIVYVP